MSAPLAFVDTETTGLDPVRHQIWEVGLVLRDENGDETERLWQLPVDLSRADAMGLKVGRFHDRRLPPDALTGLRRFAHEFATLTVGAHLKRMGQAKYQRDGGPRTSGPGFGLTLHPDALDIPLRRKKPTTWFVDSMSDLFHPEVPGWFIAEVLDVIRRSPQHTFQVLTKRPQRMADLLRNCCDPPSNLWLGTSIESDRYVWRADHLRRTPAAVRFLSLEPLLGRVPSLNLDAIDWVIVGGESGPNARPMHPDWVRQVRDRCVEAAVPFFFKQWGGRTPKAGGRELDGRTWDEMPEHAGAVA